MKNQNSPRSHQSAFWFATLASVVCWFVPFLRWITVPQQYLNTHVHEAWHAIVGLATGGMVSHIEVHANGNGETYTAGGLGFLISSAGYLGASLTGALLIALARSAKAAKISLFLLAGILAYSLIVWVRGDLFGIVSAIAWIVALGAMAIYLSDDHRLFAAQFIGVQQCLNSVQSVFFLVQISGFGIQQSDAGNMAQMTHIPAIVWSLLWSLLSLAMMVLAWRIGPGRAEKPASTDGLV